MILSGKLMKGQRLLTWKFVQIFKGEETAVSKAFPQLRKDGLAIIKGEVGSFVARQIFWIKFRRTV
jgi:DNA-binding GntR family transcriptional regulator